VKVRLPQKRRFLWDLKLHHRIIAGLSTAGIRHGPAATIAASVLPVPVDRIERIWQRALIAPTGPPVADVPTSAIVATNRIRIYARST
jgi:hypothetical protein